jgi:hypothetical protein
MRQPIVVSTRKQTSSFMLKRIVLLTVILLLAAFLIYLFPSSPGDLFGTIENSVLIVFALAAYVVLFISYYKVRTMPQFAVVIDEQGFHANKIFIPWHNIEAICPVTVRMGEFVGIYPRDFRMVLRQSSMNAILKTLYGWMAAYARMRGVPPFGIYPDTISVQELLQQIWNNYYSEYQLYHISPYRR